MICCGTHFIYSVECVTNDRENAAYPFENLTYPFGDAVHPLGDAIHPLGDVINHVSTSGKQEK